jgi:hypothetical protein
MKVNKSAAIRSPIADVKDQNEERVDLNARGAWEKTNSIPQTEMKSSASETNKY